MKKALLIALVALLIPSAALAAQSTKANKGKAAPKVMYTLKGTLSAYTAASGTTPGSITIAVSKANYHGKALRGQTLTIPTSSKTKITLHKGVTTITDGDKGTVTVKAAKKVAATDLVATLEAATAHQVIDNAKKAKGKPSKS